ncbi:MAG TPA: alpha/beta hydrolase [Flavisolibacter sp.]|nr:alpha/beta hydrolase [Flavisolibacter sp.]
MKQALTLLLFVLVLSSCQKETDGGTDNLPAKEETFLNLAYGNDAAQVMDLYLPAGRTDTTKLIMMIHGGAWFMGDKSDFTQYVSVLKQRLPGYAIANINYRLASIATNHFPTQENDMKAAVDFLVQKSGQYKISQKIVLLGASAGAHLAMLQAYKNQNPKIRAVVNFFGAADMTMLYNDAGPNDQLGIQILVGGTPTTNAAAYLASSPLNFVTAQSPPTIVLHGTADDVVNINQSEALRDKLQSLGVKHEFHPFANQIHDTWPAPVMNEAFDKIEAFVKANVQ